jgi:hypothetical protein
MRFFRSPGPAVYSLTFCPPLAEAVEELGFQAAREFAYFDFAREDRHQRPFQWL